MESQINFWRNIIEEIQTTGKRFEFKQGMDIRLMTDEKAKLLNESKYHGDYIFAFDHIRDKDLIENKLKIWKDNCKTKSQTTKLYILCGYESQDINDIVNTFERIKILMKYGCLPYIMRYKDYEKSKYRGTYINLARWCNQPNFFKKMSYRQYCEANQERTKTKICSAMRYLNEFEKDYPEIAAKYYDMKFEDLNQY